MCTKFCGCKANDQHTALTLHAIHTLIVRENIKWKCLLCIPFESLPKIVILLSFSSSLLSRSVVVLSPISDYVCIYNRLMFKWSTHAHRFCTYSYTVFFLLLFAVCYWHRWFMVWFMLPSRQNGQIVSTILCIMFGLRETALIVNRREIAFFYIKFANCAQSDIVKQNIRGRLPLHL